MKGREPMAGVTVEECKINMEKIKKLTNTNFFKFCGVVGFAILIFIGLWKWTFERVDGMMESQATALTAFKNDTFDPFKEKAIGIHAVNTDRVKDLRKADEEFKGIVKDMHKKLDTINEAVQTIKRNGH